LSREAKRQFNLGINNDVVGNIEFPRLFRRYVEIANDPLLTLDIQKENANPLSDKEKVGKAFDLLSELKGVIIQLVRSLSKYGTVATNRANKEWAEFEDRALRVLKRVGEHRFTEDLDEKRILSVLADLTEKNLEMVVAPYFALARNGGKLLRLAFEVYQLSIPQGLDTFEPDRLVELFQQPADPANWLTKRMRNEAVVLKRHPLANWG
jgi:hypothetical protein